jgi:adenylate kinase family enzyme
VHLPVVHLDLHFWTPGWVAPTETGWREVQATVLAGDEWIADGNYSDSLALRLERADTVVFLDLPWPLCVRRALRRGFQMPDELPPGCEYSRFQRWRDEWLLALRIARRGRSEPRRELAIIAEHGQHATVHVLRSPEAVRNLLAGLVDGPAGVDDR